LADKTKIEILQQYRTLAIQCDLQRERIEILTAELVREQKLRHEAEAALEKEYSK